MTTPQGMMGPQSPVSFEMLMQLRNAARGKQDMQGAAQRRLEGNTSPVSAGETPMPQQEPMQPQAPGTVVGDQTPEDIVLADMEEQMNEINEPPDINMTAANTMMRYGAVQEYLARARGEMPNG